MGFLQNLSWEHLLEIANKTSLMTFIMFTICKCSLTRQLNLKFAVLDFFTAHIFTKIGLQYRRFLGNSLKFSEKSYFRVLLDD